VRILVTGASGFVGQHLLPQLARAYPDAEVATEIGDITDAASVRSRIVMLRPDFCVHLAAISAIGDARSNPDRAWQINLTGTRNLAAALLAIVPECRMVYASTADIYGHSFKSDLALDERAVPAPMNTYGATKAAADLALGAMVSEGLNVIRLRPFNHTGPGQVPKFAVPTFARQIMRIAAGLQPPVLKVGDLSSFRDFLDVRDVCAAYVAALQPGLKFAPGAIFNIASGMPRRIGDVLDSLVRFSNVVVTVETDPALLRPSDIRMAIGNASAARDVLGWQPAIPWETTLIDVLAYWAHQVNTES